MSQRTRFHITYWIILCMGCVGIGFITSMIFNPGVIAVIVSGAGGFFFMRLFDGFIIDMLNGIGP